ncbi:hypothetical protein G6F50_011314 [Rhizopus delemar]|nr:hypothetical protein G6F50_011314 [Rhizopus delemar]
MNQAQAMFFLANAWLKLNLEAVESEMIVCYTTSTTNNEETAEGNIDETEENDNTEQDEQRVDIVECKNRLREAYETILMYEVPLDDLDRKLHCRIQMRLAGFCAELNKSKDIDSLDLWKDDSGSEATYYRRLATLFDHIFKHTDIKLVDGETGCNATKTTIAFNKAMFNTHDMAPTYPRKIDLLLKCQHSNQKDLVDMCSNEFKKAAVSKSVVISQQAKNMRINASILSTNGLLGVTDTMYFDVVGTDAYLFLLRYLREHQLYLGSLVADVLHFPTNALFLGDLRSLITALFQFKQFVLGQEKMIRRTINKQLARKRSATIVDTTNLPSSSAGGDQHSYPPGYIFFSPKAALQKKARIDTDNDDTDKDNESREN